MATGEFAFGFLGKMAPQEFRDNQAEDTVAEKFEPLITTARDATATGRAGMSQRFDQQVGLGKAVAERLLKCREAGGRFIHQ